MLHGASSFNLSSRRSRGRRPFRGGLLHPLYVEALEDRRLMDAAAGATTVELWPDLGLSPPNTSFELWPGGPLAESRPHIQAQWQVGDSLYIFLTTDLRPFPQLWKTDGTEAGTVLLLSGGSGPGFGNSFAVDEDNGDVYFAWGTYGGVGLWKTNGTREGTVLLRDNWTDGPRIDDPWPSGPRSLVQVDGDIYFMVEGFAGRSRPSIWKSDGTAQGTVRVFDLQSIVPNGIELFAWTTSDLVSLNGKMYCTASYSLGVPGSLEFHTVLLASDGTTAGTGVVTELDLPGDKYQRGRELLVAGGMLLFTTVDANDRTELWSSNGTSAGTHRLTSGADIRLISLDSERSDLVYTRRRMLVPVGDQVFFAAVTPDGLNQLWATNGMQTGTRLVMTFPGSRFNFFGQGHVGELVDVDGVAYFTMSGKKTELWRSDGTVEGTYALLTLDYGQPPMLPYALNSFPNAVAPPVASIDGLINVDGRLMFFADDGVHGRELWQSDGTVAGTGLVKDFVPGIEGSYGEALGVLNGRLIVATGADQDMSVY